MKAAAIDNSALNDKLNNYHQQTEAEITIINQLLEYVGVCPLRDKATNDITFRLIINLLNYCKSIIDMVGKRSIDLKLNEPNEPDDDADLKSIHSDRIVDIDCDAREDVSDESE
jgi:hypothetical protein